MAHGFIIPSESEFADWNLPPELQALYSMDAYYENPDGPFQQFNTKEAERQGLLINQGSGERGFIQFLGAAVANPDHFLNRPGMRMISNFVSRMVLNRDGNETRREILNGVRQTGSSAGVFLQTCKLQAWRPGTARSGINHASSGMYYGVQKGDEGFEYPVRSPFQDRRVDTLQVYGNAWGTIPETSKLGSYYAKFVQRLIPGSQRPEWECFLNDNGTVADNLLNLERELRAREKAGQLRAQAASTRVSDEDAVVLFERALKMEHDAMPIEAKAIAIDILSKITEEVKDINGEKVWIIRKDAHKIMDTLMMGHSRAAQDLQDAFQIVSDNLNGRVPPGHRNELIPRTTQVAFHGVDGGYYMKREGAERYDCNTLTDWEFEQAGNLITQGNLTDGVKVSPVFGNVQPWSGPKIFVAGGVMADPRSDGPMMILTESSGLDVIQTSLRNGKPYPGFSHNFAALQCHTAGVEKFGHTASGYVQELFPDVELRPSKDFQKKMVPPDAIAVSLDGVDYIMAEVRPSFVFNKEKGVWEKGEKPDYHPLSLGPDRNIVNDKGEVIKLPRTYQFKRDGEDRMETYSIHLPIPRREEMERY